jgi:hypothetical protein
MTQRKQQEYPKRRDPEVEPSLTSPKPPAPTQLSETNLDEILSKDAEEFLRKNPQKGGE